MLDFQSLGCFFSGVQIFADFHARPAKSFRSRPIFSVSIEILWKSNENFLGPAGDFSCWGQNLVFGEIFRIIFLIPK